MKKIIALLAVVALMFTVAPLAFADASVNYVVTLGDAVSVGGVNVYPLNISIDTVNATAGHLTLKWDTTKVKPYYNFNGMMAGEITSAQWASFGAMHYAVSNTGKVEVAHTAQLDNGYYEIDWSATAYTAGNTFLTLNFGLVGSTTVEDFDVDTFTLPSESELNTLGTTSIKSKGAFGITQSGTEYGATAGTCGIIFNTYKSDEPEDWKGTVVDGKPSDATIEDSDFKFPTKTDDRDSDSKDTTAITRKAVMFAKAVDKLDAETYGIKIGDFFYPGIAEVPAGSYWSIVLVTTDDEALKGSYEYIPMIKTNAVGAELEGTEKADAKTLVVE